MSHGSPHDARDGVARRTDGAGHDRDIEELTDLLADRDEVDDVVQEAITQLSGRQVEVLEQQQERIELLEEQNEFIRSQSVFTVAVEQVLLEYGLSTERVDEIVAAIEDVDAQLKAGDDDV